MTSKVTAEQSVDGDGVLTVTLAGVPCPCVEGFPLPTTYILIPPTEGEIIDGLAVEGWAEFDNYMWGQQKIAVLADLRGRMGYDTFDPEQHQGAFILDRASGSSRTALTRL